MVSFCSRRARLQAERAVDVHDEVLAMVSHDLRGPLGAIRLTAEALDRTALTDQAGAVVRTGAQRILRAADRMTALIDDLLDHARLESGRIALRCDLHDARSLVEEAVQIFEPVAREKGLRIAARAEGGVRVHCDSSRIFQVLSNLLGNAIKFTTTGTVVAESGIDRMRTAARFVVADTGPGIAPKNLPRIFDAFWQASPDGRRGAGLGLSIARGIVEAHGGRIWADSEPGRGTSISFTLPATDGDSPRTE